jgi:hypothetical protein
MVVNVGHLQVGLIDRRFQRHGLALGEQCTAHSGAARELGREGVSAELKESTEALLAQALAAEKARDLAEAHRLSEAAACRAVRDIARCGSDIDWWWWWWWGYVS